MTLSTRTGIDAAPDAVWAVIAGVADWPEFIPTVTWLRHETPGGLGRDTRVRIKQPGMPPLVWTVTGIEDGVAFTWTTTGGGVTTAAAHRVTARPGGGSVLELTIDQRGPLAPLVRWAFGRRTLRYMETEARSVKGRAEAA